MEEGASKIYRTTSWSSFDFYLISSTRYALCTTTPFTISPPTAGSSRPLYKLRTYTSSHHVQHRVHHLFPCSRHPNVHRCTNFLVLIHLNPAMTLKILHQDTYHLRQLHQNCSKRFVQESAYMMWHAHHCPRRSEWRHTTTRRQKWARVEPEADSFVVCTNTLLNQSTSKQMFGWIPAVKICICDYMTDI